ncbi:MAG: hypothetical protein JSV78_05515 [Phycisphaerales bacterium]|nr:MAG: hypothetical protein JSV78_05515 [Phycisphaerales bacterium]
MNQDVLEHLYEATEEDLLYGIGTLPVADSVALPLIHVHYRHWSREKLIVVRASFESGLDLVIGEPSCGCREMRLSTREQVSVQVKEDGHTHVLRSLAWDACLEGVAEHVVRRFEQDCHQAHGYVLLMQTPAWEFLTAVERACGRTHVQPITTRAYPCPPMA